MFIIYSFYLYISIIIIFCYYYYLFSSLQMLLVMRSANLKKEETWLLDVAKFLFFHGHFHTVKKKSKDEVILFFSRLCFRIFLFFICDIKWKE